jgi:VWFA-related protein
VAKVTCFIRLLGLVSMWAVAGHAQAPERQPGRFGTRIQVRLGSVAVAVVDADRRPVCDLGAADFALRIAGQERAITHFEACQPAATTTPAAVPGPASPAMASPDPEDETVWVVVVDQGNISVFSRKEVLLRLATFVRARVRPPDRVTILVLSKRLEVVCPLTTDVDAVIRAIETLGASTAGVGTSRAIMRMGEAQIRLIWEEPGGMKPDRMMMTARAAAGQIRDILRSTCGNLERLMRSLAGVEGRKALVYVSDGLPMQPARELFTLVTEFYPMLSTTGGGADSFQADDLFAELGDFAAAAGVAFYPIDALGVHNTAGFEAERRESHSNEVATLTRYNHQQTLSYLAARTGGVAVLNTNDFAGALGRIADTVEQTCTLGFPLDGLEPDRPLRVEVALRAPRDVRLHYRPVFVNRRPDTAVADRTSAGLLFDLADNPLHVSLSTQPPRAVAKTGCTVPLVIRVPLAGLALPPEGDELAGVVTVFYQAGDAEGRRSALARTRHEIRLPADRAAAVRELAVTTEVEIGAGNARVSVGVLDEVSGLAGYAAAQVTCAATAPAH